MSKPCPCLTPKREQPVEASTTFPNMARYYFHIRDHDRLIVDDEGLDLPGDAEAFAEAECSAGDLIADAALGGDDVAHQVIEVSTPEGRLVGSVPLAGRITRH